MQGVPNPSAAHELPRREMAAFARAHPGGDRRPPERQPHRVRRAGQGSVGTAAGLSLIALARLAGLDDKTIANVERTRIFIARKTIEALLAVPVLGLSWADVGLELLEETRPTGGGEAASETPRQTMTKWLEQNPSLISILSLSDRRV